MSLDENNPSPCKLLGERSISVAGRCACPLSCPCCGNGHLPPVGWVPGDSPLSLQHRVCNLGHELFTDGPFPCGHLLCSAPACCVRARGCRYRYRSFPSQKNWGFFKPRWKWQCVVAGELLVEKVTNMPFTC